MIGSSKSVANWNGLIFAALLVLSNWGAIAQPRAPDSVIVEFEGSGTSTTRPFRAIGPWEVQWEVVGPMMTIFSQIVGKSQPYEKVLVMFSSPNEQPRTAGKSYNEKAGDYYLDIQAVGGWKVKVVNVVAR